jgi:hypothetical protein
MSAGGNMIYGELEIGLSRVSGGSYQVELRLTDPDTDTDQPPTRGEAALTRNSLAPLAHLADEMGQALTDSLFSDPKIHSFYSSAKATFERNGRILRLRLAIGPSVPELNDLPWELLRDPDTQAPLSTSERMLFSRFMQSSDWRAVKLNAKPQLKVLIAVSAPRDVADYQMAEVDVDGEVSRAREALGGIECSVIGQAESLTPQLFIDSLRKAPDIVYLVSHGSFPKDMEPVLFFEDDDEKTQIIKAGDLAQRICELTQLPRLIVLASCESAGRGGLGPSMGSFAPRLANAGIPAILAMQGRISQETVKRMMPVFFHELLADGQIDRALGVARGVVRDQLDFWVPALFLRLRSGRIWYVPCFAGGKDDFEWKSICRFVRSGEFVPLIGPDLAEHVYGTVRSLANDLATTNGYPLSPTDQSDLARVTQYIETRTSVKDVRGQLRGLLLKNLVRRAQDQGISIEQKATPTEIVAAVADRVANDDQNPIRILAGLDAKVFVSAASDPLFEMVLSRCGKQPVACVPNWRDERRGAATLPSAEPAAAKPLIYYVFGKTQFEESWVLTEDDFFDYTIRMSEFNLMPPVVSEALTGSALLFLGFPLHDWKFRLLLRIILSKGGHANLDQYNHVGVQMDPEEHSFADAVRAAKYLELYFRKAKNINIYWGSSADFLNELRRQMRSLEAEEPVMTITAASAW